jgi:PAS domain S-box-containing protein
MESSGGTVTPTNPDQKQPQDTSTEGSVGRAVDVWALLGALPVPMVAHDSDARARVRFVNASFTAAFGYTLADIPDIAVWSEMAYPDEAYRSEILTRWWSEIAARRATGAISKPGEYRIFDKAGMPRDVLIGFALQDNLVIVSCQDLTQIRVAEAALEAERRANERTAFALTENMPAGAYTMVLRPDAELAEFAFVSKQFLQMLELTHEEVVGDPMTGFSRVHPEDRPNWVKANAEAFARLQPFSAEARIVANGETRWIRAESVPRQLDYGQAIWEGVLVDINDLKQSEAKLKAVLEASYAFTWELDLRSQVVRFDKYWSAAHGYGTEEKSVSLATWLETLHPDDVPIVNAGLEALKQRTSEKQSPLYRRKEQNSNWSWMQAHAGVREYDAAGLPVVLSGVSFDITAEMTVRARAQEEQAQLREDLQRAQQKDTVSQVAGGVAHDLNNLVAVIAGTTEMLELQAMRQPSLMEGLDRIRRAVDTARDLIGGLAGLTRPSPPREAQDLGSLLKNAVDLLGLRRVAQHDVRLTLCDSKLKIWANATEVAQIVVNLAINACDSGDSDQPAKVKLAILPPDSEPPSNAPDAGMLAPAGIPLAMFTITDTGKGITDDIRSRMFRSNFSTKGKAGTGLGLLIVSTILRANRAALWVDTKIGQGTTMTVAWPSAAPLQTDTNGARQDAAKLDASVTDAPLNGMHIVVVDDLADVAEVLADMLAAAGAVAVPFSSPKEAKKALAEAPEFWSVLVTDLHMDEMGGRVLAQYAGTLSTPVPVVLVTARPDTLGDTPVPEFATILSKPVTAASLVQSVLDVVTRCRAGG